MDLDLGWWRGFVPRAKKLEEQINIAISILSALLTGGFILFFVENQHIERDVIERYRTIMNPYYHKLSSYLKFVYFISGRISYSNQKDDYIQELRSLTKELSSLGGEVYFSGRDVSFLSAKELERLNDNINNIWYYYDKGWMVKNEINFDSNESQTYTDSQIIETLSDLSHKYAIRSIDKTLLPSVSGDFYAETWQAISYVTHNFEYWQRNCEKSKVMLLVSLSFVMIVLIVAMFFSDRFSHLFISIPTVFCCLFFTYDLFQLNKLMKLSHRIFR